VLLISNGEYPGGNTGLEPLNCATYDRVEIKKLLGSSSIDDKPLTLIDGSKAELQETWNEFVIDVKIKAKLGPVLAFVHVTSHGCINKQDD